MPNALHPSAAYEDSAASSDDWASSSAAFLAAGRPRPRPDVFPAGFWKDTMHTLFYDTSYKTEIPD